MGGPNSIGNKPNSIGNINMQPHVQGQGKGAQNARLQEFTLTIDDFRKFASGAYNAGGANGGERTRFAWARMENAEADPTEAAALRLSFAFALESAGVSGERMADACRRLGLEADFSFSEKSSKMYAPLSREEVRDILERGFAAPKNAKQPPPKKNDTIRPKAEKGDRPLSGGIKEKDSFNNIINDNKLIIKDDDDFIIKDNGNKFSIIDSNDDDFIKHDDIIINNRRNSIDGDNIIKETKLEDEPYDPEKMRALANKNLRTVVTALTEHYGKNFNLEANEIESIIKQVPDWEVELANCSTEGGDTLRDLNDDLRNFVANNQEYIQPLIDYAIEQKKNS